MGEYQKKLLRILKNDYGVRSGVYSAIDPKIKMKMDKRGEYQPVFSGQETERIYKNLLSVDMMSDESSNEDEIGQELFANIGNIKHDPVLGYYSDLYVGYVSEGNFREQG